jgi:hypothetical protein
MPKQLEHHGVTKTEEVESFTDLRALLRSGEPDFHADPGTHY